MIFSELPLKGVYEISLQVFGDDRGWFGRTYCKNEFAKHGLIQEWVQMNHSFTAKKGTIRGMHFQYPPHGEIKMVRCIAGEVFDVVVDLRASSPTFLQYTSVVLSAAKRNMIYIPKGFAHGFQTLSDNAELLYQHDAFYTPEAEGGLRYNEPSVNIAWPNLPTELSKRDENHPLIDLSVFKGI